MLLKKNKSFKEKIKFIYTWIVVPKGDYCYKLKKVIYDKQTNGMPVLKIKKCPYWCWDERYPDEEIGYCKYLGIGDKDKSSSSGLLFDQIKECGIKYYE